MFICFFIPIVNFLHMIDFSMMIILFWKLDIRPKDGLILRSFVKTSLAVIIDSVTFSAFRMINHQLKIRRKRQCNTDSPVLNNGQWRVLIFHTNYDAFSVNLSFKTSDKWLKNISVADFTKTCLIWQAFGRSHELFIWGPWVHLTGSLQF